MDNLSKKDRSKCMSRIRSANTAIEKQIFSILDKRGVYYQKHYKKAPGKPDIAVPSLKLAVFLDSDFWHGWYFPKWKDRLPKEYWRDKIERNRERDKKNFAILRRRGWKVIRLWGHKIKKNPERCADLIAETIEERNKLFQIKTISLFSGCGGMDLGIEGGFTYLGKRYRKTKFKIIWANDIDKFACETFNANFEGIECICGDIEKDEIWNIMPEQCDMIIGGFPCQDFSITRATKRKGIGVKRGKLYKYFVKTISEKKPKVFIAENVKGILSVNKGQAIELITREFAHIIGGYNIYCDLYKFVEYGVPQKRERVLIIGIRSDVEYEYAKPKLLRKEEYITAGQALERMPKGAPNHDFMKILERTKRIIEAIPEGQNINFLPKEHPLYVKGLMSNIYRRLDRKKPSPTIIACGGGGTWGYHYEEPRALTNRERARIQSFPDNFKFSGGISDVRRQIGNAVPPVGIYPVAKELKKAFKAQNGIYKLEVKIRICGKTYVETLKNEPPV